MSNLCLLKALTTWQAAVDEVLEKKMRMNHILTRMLNWTIATAFTSLVLYYNQKKKGRIAKLAIIENLSRTTSSQEAYLLWKEQVIGAEGMGPSIEEKLEEVLQRRQRATTMHIVARCSAVY